MSFRADFRATTHSNDVPFTWRGSIEGLRDGEIRFQFEGEAKHLLRSNRIGLVVLYPLLLAGTSCVVEHVDGSHSVDDFPVLVAPDQPFLSSRALRYAAVSGAQVRIDFEGDVLEMEDQRNWSDASSKTFPRPLSEPFPFELGTGEKIVQAVTIRVSRTGEGLERALPERLTTRRKPLVVPAAITEMPAIGLCWTPSMSQQDAQEAVAALAPAFLRVDIFADDSESFEDLARAHIDNSSSLGVPLDLAIHVGQHSEQFRRISSPTWTSRK